MRSHLFDAVQEALPRLDGGRYLVAYSGGLDSTVLLHIMAENTDPGSVHAVHVQHDLQAQAAGWAAHCRVQAQLLGLPFSLYPVQVERDSGRGLEAAAREARYRALARAMQPGDVLLTAHHAEDQAQTFLLQALRGSGVRGLAAMPRQAAFGPGQHVRPMLSLSREQIRRYAEDQELQWVDDPSNRDVAVDRSYLATEVWPRITEHWPGAAATLSRAAAWCAQASASASDRAGQDRELCAGSGARCLSVARLLALPRERRWNLLREWLHGQGLPPPRVKHLQIIETDCLAARQDAQPLVSWPGAEVRRYRDDLHAMTPLARAAPGWQAAWAPPAALALPQGGELVAHPAQRQGGLATEHQYQVRFRRDGDRLRLPGHRQEIALKTLCQDVGVPTWLRGRLPLVVAQNRIAAVADLCICHGFLAPPEKPGWQLSWRGAPAGWPPAGAGAVNSRCKIG